MNHILLTILPTGASGPPRFTSFLRRSLFLTSLCFCLAGPGAGRAQAGVGETWEWRNPLPQGSGIKALAEAGGRLIATGRAGTILTTSDGMNWTRRESGTRNYLQAVAASGTTLVAVGREGDIVTSTDGGLTWALRSSGAVEWNTVVHGGGVWVAGGVGFVGALSTGAVMTSLDGLTWTTRSVPNAGGTEFLCAVWTSTRFVLGGTNLNTAPGTVLATSEDGTIWTQRAAPLTAVNGLVWTGARVVAAGQSTAPSGGEIYVSPDGIIWIDALTPNAPAYFGGVAWNGTQLLAWPVSSSQAAYTSPTGETWTPGAVLSTNPQFNPGSAAGAGTTLVVGGDRGLIVRSVNSGATWSLVSSGVAGNLNALTRFAGRWVAAGGEGSLTSSSDGVTWTPASSGTLSRFRAIAWHNGLWMAGGREEVTPPGLTGRRQYSLFTSTDGVTWTDRSFGSTGGSRRQIYSVIRAGSQWVAAALGAVLTSPDGITWQERPAGSENRAVAWNGNRLLVVGGQNEGQISETGLVNLSDDGGVTWGIQAFGQFLRGVTWTGSQFVVVGDQHGVYTSQSGDAGSWTFHTSGSDTDLRCVMADAGSLVAVGANDTTGSAIRTSRDGVTWTPRTAPTTQVLYSVIKAGTLYVATGYDGVVLTSPDAITWTLRQTPTTHELYAAAWDGRQLLVAGEGGAILASPAQAITVP